MLRPYATPMNGNLRSASRPPFSWLRSRSRLYLQWITRSLRPRSIPRPSEPQPQSRSPRGGRFASTIELPMTVQIAQ